MIVLELPLLPSSSLQRCIYWGEHLASRPCCLLPNNVAVSGVQLVPRKRSSANSFSAFSHQSAAFLAIQTNPQAGAHKTSDTASGFWSVIIPTYNRLPILQKCLAALEEQLGYAQFGVQEYEVLVVDDGSTDGTAEYLIGKDAVAGVDAVKSSRFHHVKVLVQEHGGAAKARNLGIRHARGSTVVFIDSDMVVAKDFIKEHARALRNAYAEDGDDMCFTYGRVVNTSNFDHPQSEKFKLTDYSAAYFATGNVAISKRLLLSTAKSLKGEGPFDTEFTEYGWEDLELGVRLRQEGAKIRRVPTAVGYHWHPAFTCDQLPKLIEQERQRGRGGVHFYRKHPKLNVRLMTQLTPFHEFIWMLLTIGGLLNEKTLQPLLWCLVQSGHNSLAAAFLSPVLNWHTVRAAKEELNQVKRW